MMTDKKKGSHMVTTIETTYEIKSTVYCKFHHYTYPLDHQRCLVNTGSSSHGAIFVLDNREHLSEKSVEYSSSDFNISMTLFDQNTGMGNNYIGINNYNSW